MDGNLIYIIGLICVAIIAISGVWLMRKYHVTDKEKESLALILKIIDYITNKTSLTYKGEISIVVKYCLEALYLIEKYQEAEDILDKKKVVKEETLDILKANNIKVDKEVIALVDEVINFIVDNNG